MYYIFAVTGGVVGSICSLFVVSSFIEDLMLFGIFLLLPKVCCSVPFGQERL